MVERSRFLPYQLAWLRDPSPVKLWEKSRRIGATYTQAYEDVSDCVWGVTPAVWFSSSDETAAREYVRECKEWARLLNALFTEYDEPFVDDRDVTVHGIEFRNGTRINALSSNPKQFRSKGGKVVLDEYAFHERPLELWRAARPVTTWHRGEMRVISTHNGKGSQFCRFVEACRRGELGWSLHRTTIAEAVGQGLLERIRETQGLPPPSEADKERWLRELREDCFDEETWLQEYCCVPVDESRSFLTLEFIAGSEREGILWASLDSPLAEPSGRRGGPLYLGMDIGRRRDLTVIWLLEEAEGALYTRAVRTMERAPFSEQQRALAAFLSHPGLRRACIDASGIGMQLAEEAVERFGKYRVEPVQFTAPVKEELAYALRIRMEQRTLFIPPHPAIRSDLHSVRKTVTAAGNLRFDAGGEAGGASERHADRFWALALAAHAAHTHPGGPAELKSRPRPSRDLLKGFG